LWEDVFYNHRDFFDPNDHDSKFLFWVSLGFNPRIFPCSKDYNIIYEEEQEVSEMYFIIKGKVQIGFSRFMEPKDGSDYMTVMDKTAYQEIGAYYVTQNLPSEFVYMAVHENMEGYALSKEFFLGKILKEFPTKVK
jgi:hypothetical protein